MPTLRRNIIDILKHRENIKITNHYSPTIIISSLFYNYYNKKCKLI